MRRALALATLLLLLAPIAGAAGLEPQGPRAQERPLVPGGPAVFELAVRALGTGALYAKILPTPGNAIHDGARANGSAEQREGWWAHIAAVLPDGTERALGAYSDGTRTDLVPVQEGDVVTFLVAVHAPPDATRGTVYVAIAHRESATPGAGGSGADLEDARAFTLRLLGADETPAPATPATPTPATPAPPTPSTAEPAPERTPARADRAAPDPLLVLGLVLLGAIVVLLAAIATLLALLLRELRRRGEETRTLPLQEADAAPLAREPKP